MNDVRVFNDLLIRLTASWQALPGKPKEILRVLWYLAAGDPWCIGHVAQTGLPLPSEPERIRLNELVEKRLAGVPLVYLTGWQQFT
jgi:release factor glutamine methyltransferase